MKHILVALFWLITFVARAQDFVYKGCFNDGDVGEHAMDDAEFDAVVNTTHDCSTMCKDFKYFAIQRPSLCLCEDDFGDVTQFGRASEQDCPSGVGAPFMNAVYAYFKNCGHVYVGCFEGDINESDVNGDHALHEGVFTVEECSLLCSGYNHFAVQSENQCVCHDELDTVIGAAECANNTRHESRSVNRKTVFSYQACYDRKKRRLQDSSTTTTSQPSRSPTSVPTVEPTSPTSHPTANPTRPPTMAPTSRTCSVIEWYSNTAQTGWRPDCVSLAYLWTTADNARASCVANPLCNAVEWYPGSCFGSANGHNYLYSCPTADKSQLTWIDESRNHCSSSVVTDLLLVCGTLEPTNSPTTAAPTAPTGSPTTSIPSRPPTSAPTSSTATPSESPTSYPSRSPTSVPTMEPTSPTSQPTASPTTPTQPPTMAPTPRTCSVIEWYSNTAQTGWRPDCVSLAYLWTSADNARASCVDNPLCNAVEWYPGSCFGSSSGHNYLYSCPTTDKSQLTWIDESRNHCSSSVVTDLLLVCGTLEPTTAPTTAAPTAPTDSPTTSQPSRPPTDLPTVQPTSPTTTTLLPTSAPSAASTETPTRNLDGTATKRPTSKPSAVPTDGGASGNEASCHFGLSIVNFGLLLSFCFFV